MRHFSICSNRTQAPKISEPPKAFASLRRFCITNPAMGAGHVPKVYSQESDGGSRISLRPAPRSLLPWLSRSPENLSVPLRLWPGARSFRDHNTSARKTPSKMLLPTAAPQARPKANSRVSHLATHDWPLPQLQPSRFWLLRRTRHHDLRALAFLRRFLRRYGIGPFRQTHARSLARSERQLRTRQCSLGNEKRTGEKHSFQSDADLQRADSLHLRVGRSLGHFRQRYIVPPASRLGHRANPLNTLESEGGAA